MEPIEDDPSPYIKFDHFPMEVAFKKITAILPSQDFNGDPCTALEGELLKQLDSRKAGEIARVGGGQTKLKRLIEKGIKADRIKVGAPVTIKHTGMIGRMLDFEIEAPNPKSSVTFDQFPGTPRDDKPPF
jgi:hypothetical protein